ncbi:MAG TPA: laccase domain-containing protein, partial [Candidatus Pseudomonas excrementavium]|nr:laccase domain-containing protein [Candidatus Pseudomonas excrementavium]
MKAHWLQADWPAPEWVKTCVTTRQDGSSQGVYKGFNLGTHVGDDLNSVLANRAELGRLTGCRLAWLEQTHSTDVVEAAPGLVEEADASWTLEPDVACVIMTADCLPVLFCDRAGTRVA